MKGSTDEELFKKVNKLDRYENTALLLSCVYDH